MGLFDKLFKKKKSPPVSKGLDDSEVSVVRSPVRQPQAATAPKKSVRIRSPPGQVEDSVGRQPSRQMEPRRIVRHKKVKSRARPVSSGDVAVRLPKAEQAADAKRVRSRQEVDAEGAPKLIEDTIGEEELFKKLAQWDKNLKERVADVQAKPGAPAQPPKQRMRPTAPAPSAPVAPIAKPAPLATPTEEKKPKSAAELQKFEAELKAYERKLKQRERGLSKKEELKSAFGQIEDTDLEMINKGATPGGGELSPDVIQKEAQLQKWEQDILKREQELQKATEAKTDQEISEELTQPLKNLTFNNFIVGPSNRFAHDVALAVAKTPADAYNPLFIYSQVGLGKTHLLCGIGNYIKSKNPNARVVYASSEKFTNELLDYLRLGEMERFRIKYRNVDVLLIDDIQFIGGQEGTQEEFFHTFNSLYNEHKQIVITSDRPPKNIAHLKDRLRSRFEGGLIVNIKKPDLSTRTMILHEKAEKDGIYIPDEIINYIATKVKSNVRTLIGILNRVVAHSSLTDRELDTSLVDDVLTDVMDEKLQLPED
jgi:chromosomal replication initiator protein DnaA